MLLTGDIQKYFPSISPDAVLKAFRQLGISYQVSKLLVNLCTHEGQLPQGAPTSPLISNLIWGRPARRIKGFADQHGFDQTIFGDDVFISGAKRAKKFKNLLKRIVQEEGDEFVRVALAAFDDDDAGSPFGGLSDPLRE